MSRPRAAAAGAALLLLLALLFRQSAPGASARPSDLPPPAPARRPPPAATAAPIPPPARDIFSYAGQDDGEEAAPSMADFPTTLASAPPSLADVPPPVPGGPRLVGILRQGGVLKAALAIGGEVVIAGAGETVEGYAIVSIDEEEGVRLRDAAGSTLTLSPPL